MSGCYLDASALVKLAIRELETDALRAHLALYANHATSRLAAVEVPRALARRGPESVVAGAAAVASALEGLTVIDLDEAIVVTAAALAPASLRSFDAIHLATALSMGPDLDALITYDARLGDAARAAGMPVVAPA